MANRPEIGSPVIAPIYADFDFGLGTGPHPETREPVVMGLLSIMHNGNVVTCVLCREMLEALGKGFLEEAPNVTFSAEVVDELEKKHNVN